MEAVSISDIRDNLADALNRVAYRHERIALQRRGKTVAVLISADEASLLDRLIEEAEQRIDLEEVRKVRAEGGRPIPLAEVTARLGLTERTRPKSRKRAKK
jgi:prevent-host-death family protein